MYPVQTNLTGQVAVVTGGNGVIGGMFCRALAACGATIAILCRRPETAQPVISDIESMGRVAKAFRGDVMQKESLLAAREEILQAFGHINILINCAGGAVKGATIPQDQFADATADMTTFFNIDSAGIQKELDLNIYGTILPTQIFGEVMVGQDNANIINIASMGSYHPMTRIPGYAGAKAAVANFTEWAATYFAKSGVRVNAIAPGFFQTTQNRALQFNPDGTPTPRSGKIIAATPMERFGQPEELVTALYFLTNPASTFVTGAIIPVDGGFHCYLGV